MRDGYGIIAGRSAKNARAALDAADAAGVDQRLVEAVDGGYEVPLAVLDAYEEKVLGKKGKHDPEAEKPTKEDKAEAKAAAADARAEAKVERTEARDAAKAERAEAKAERAEEPPRAGSGSSHEAWIEWATETHGYDPAEGLSRKELIERYGE